MPKTTPAQSQCQVITDENMAADLLRKYGLEYGFDELEAAIVQYGDPRDPKPHPAALLIVNVDGQRRLVKTSLRMLLTVAQTLDAAAKREHGEGWRGP